MLGQETQTLGATLKAMADKDPAGSPSEAVAAVFGGWLAEAGPLSRQPDYFTDVAANYRPRDHSNRDLSDLFTMLAMHLPGDEPEAATDPLAGVFIGLPVINE